MARRGTALALVGACGIGVVAWRGSVVARQPSILRLHGARIALAAASPSRCAMVITAPVTAPSGGPPAVRADMFGALPAPPPKAAPPPKPPPPPPVTCAPAPDPLAGYVYRGLARIGDRQFALVEDPKTKQGRFLQVGDVLEGFSVTAMDRRALTLSAAATARELAMSGDFDVLPLDRDAPYLGGRETPHKPSETAQLVTFMDGGRVLRLSNSLVLSNSSGEDIQKLTNDVYDGRISQDEFDRRTAGTARLETFNLVLTDTATAADLGDVKHYTAAITNGGSWAVTVPSAP